MSPLAPRKVVRLDLEHDLSALPLDPRFGGLHVTFWWRGYPLGQRELPNHHLPLSATEVASLAAETIAPAVGHRLSPGAFQVALPGCSPPPPRSATPAELRTMATLDRPLSRLSAEARPRDGGAMSVVVCTRDRPEQLARCLRFLTEMSEAPAEMLVVDNAPTSDATRQVVAAVPGVRYVLEPLPGLSRARNTGIRSSQGDIVAFTDDDVEVHPDWITGLRRGFSGPDVLAVTGLVLPAELETDAQVIFEDSGGFGQGYRSRLFDRGFLEKTKRSGTPVWRIGAGANMAMRRTAFTRVGDFDERLGAGAAGCSEDSEFWYRLLAEGGVCRYEPTAVVFHHHRREMNELKHQAYQYMRGHVAALLVQFARYRHWSNLRRVAFDLPKYYARQLVDCAIDGADPRRPLVWPEIRGCASGIAFMLASTTRSRRAAPRSTTAA
jgi:GT2 family glycosyltransferase